MDVHWNSTLPTKCAGQQGVSVYAGFAPGLSSLRWNTVELGEVCGGGAGFGAIAEVHQQRPPGSVLSCRGAVCKMCP